MKSKKTILIVDDDKQFVDIFGLLLEMELENKYEYEILKAYDGMECLNLLKTTIPDMIILDLHMPSMDGIKATRILRSGKKNQKIPIIGISANGQKDLVAEWFDVGVTRYFDKPFDPEVFLKAMYKLID